MSLIIQGSTFDSEMRILPNANVAEVNLAGAIISSTRSDENGKFKLSVSSQNSFIQISHVGFVTNLLKVSEFLQLGYVQIASEIELLGDVQVVQPSKDKSNSNLWIVLGILGLGGLYLATRKKQPEPRTVKV